MATDVLTKEEPRGPPSNRARHPGKTPPFLGPRGEVVPGSIAEIGYRRLGGVDQWILARSESVDNPPLILLHGGPGLSETDLFRYYNAPLEKSFTVVYWDQRVAGKSFDSAIPRSSMTVEQFLSDLDERRLRPRARQNHRRRARRETSAEEQDERPEESERRRRRARLLRGRRPHLACATAARATTTASTPSPRKAHARARVQGKGRTSNRINRDTDPAPTQG